MIKLIKSKKRIVLEDTIPKNKTITKRKQQRSKTMSSMVALFLNGYNCDVQRPWTGGISQCKFFIMIDGQKITSFEDDLYKYYDKVWFNKSKDGNAFSVRFANFLRHGDQKICPSFSSMINQLNNPTIITSSRQHWQA